MIMKLLLLAAVIAAVYFLFFKKKSPAVSPSKKDAEATKEEETMVPCETCGVYTSIKEAYLKEGRYYCSKTCMEKH